MKKLLITTTLATVLALGVTGQASASPLSTTYTAVLYQYTNPNTGSSTDPSQQALPGAQSTGKNVVTSNFTYTGALNFIEPAGGTNTVAAFIASGGGTTTGTVPNTILSGGNFTSTSLFEFTFTTASAIAGIITHDDGASLFASTAPTVDLLPFGDSAPTNAENSAFSIGPGTYNLFYTEANGLPAQLTMNVVPEPSTLVLLGAGLIGAGVMSRRARKNDTFA